MTLRADRTDGASAATRRSRATSARLSDGLRELLSLVDKGHFVEPSKVPLKDYLEHWLKNHVAINNSPRTHEGYRSIARRHVVPSLGHIPLVQITPADVQAYYTARLEGGLSPTSARCHHALLHRALNVAVREGRVTRNVASLTTPPRTSKFEGRMLSPEETQQLLDAFGSTDYFLAVYLADFTGLRRGEVLGLQWRDVDLETGTLYVRRTLAPIDGQERWEDTKTKSSSREIALSPSTVLTLRLEGERQDAGLAEHNVALTPRVQICAKPDGDLLKPYVLSQGLRRIADRAGFEGVRFHDLRHTHASLLLGAATPLSVVTDRMGHESITTTVNTYGHVLPEAEFKAAAALDRILLGDKMATNPS